MKKIFLLIIALSFVACASLSPSNEELQGLNRCVVWKNGPIGTKPMVTVEGELAKQKITCLIMNMFVCSYTNYTFKEGTNDIVSDLPPKDKVIGTLNGQKMTVNMTGITVDPFEIGKDRADYMLQGPIGPKQSMSVEFNQRCSTRQVALGLLAIIGR